MSDLHFYKSTFIINKKGGVWSLSFTGFYQQTFDFLLNISINNNKAYFEEHRDEYIQYVHTPLMELEEEIAPLILGIDSRVQSGRRAVSRIYRDTRFSKNKDPYRDHMWIGYRPQGVSNSEYFGIFFSISPVSYDCGMGMYGPRPAYMEELRKKILANTARVETLMKDSSLQRFELKGEDYRKPKISVGSPEILSLVNKRYFYFIHTEGDINKTMSASFSNEIKREIEALTPMYKFVHDLA